MKVKRSILLVLATLCAGGLFSLERAEMRPHKKTLSAGRSVRQDGEPVLDLAGTIGPTITSPIIARNLHLIVPVNTVVKKGDVIGTEDSDADPADVGKARQELADAGSEERRAVEALHQVEEQLTAVECRISNMDREEVRAGAQESDAERELAEDDRLYRAGLTSRLAYNAASEALASAEAAVEAVQSSLSETSIDTDELEALAVGDKVTRRDATARRRAAEMVVERMRGGAKTKQVVSPADGVIVASAEPDGTRFGIASDGQLFAFAMLPEAELMHVWIGQEASIVLDAEPSATLHAQVIAIAETPVDSPDGCFYELTFAVEKQERPWVTGVAMHVQLARSSRNPAIAE